MLNESLFCDMALLAEWDVITAFSSASPVPKAAGKREGVKKNPAHKTRPSGYLQAAPGSPVPSLCYSIWQRWCVPDRAYTIWLSETYMKGNHMQRSILFVTQVLINPI